MSNNDPKPTVTAVPETSETEATEPKLTFIQKSKTFVKNHKRPAIAVGALVGLVGVAALTGRKSADVTVGLQSPLVLEDPEIVDAEIVENDTVTA